MYTKEFLMKIKYKALRKKTWFTSIDRVERAIFSLATEIKECVKSSLLCIQIMKIVSKLKSACESSFLRHMNNFGYRRVRAIQIYAASFGYNNVNELGRDPGFLKYITFLDFNKTCLWRTNS